MAGAGGQESNLLFSAEFWVAVAFFLFLGAAIYWRVHHHIASALDAHARKVADELEQARRLKEEAEAALAAARELERKSHEQVDAIVAQAEADAAAMAREAEEALAGLVSRREAAAQVRIAQARDTAIRELRSVAAETAVKTVEAVLREELTGDKAAAFTNRALGEVTKRLPS